MNDEDRIAGIALGKTIVVLFYAILIPFLVTPIGFWLDSTTLSSNVKEVIEIGIALFFFSLLVFLVVKGWMPGSAIVVACPFSETQLAASITLISAAAWVIGLVLPVYKYIPIVANVFLILGVLVFFITKSIITHRIRLRVLSALILPGIQIAYQILFNV